MPSPLTAPDAQRRTKPVRDTPRCPPFAAAHDRWVFPPARHGHGHGQLGLPAVISRNRLPGFGGWAELRGGDKTKRDLLFSTQRIMLWSSRCYLCGRGPSLGIDREDSNGYYSEGNSRPHVCAHTSAWVLGDVMDIPLRGSTHGERQPVAMAADNGKMPLFFPSISKAAEIIGSNKWAIGRAIESGCKLRGYIWSQALPMRYRRQNCETHFCVDILTFASQPDPTCQQARNQGSSGVPWMLTSRMYYTMHTQCRQWRWRCSCRLLITSQKISEISEKKSHPYLTCAQHFMHLSYYMQALPCHS